VKAFLLILVLALPAASSARPLWNQDNGEVQLDMSVLDEIMNKSEEAMTVPIGGLEYSVQINSVSRPNLGVVSFQGTMDDNPDSFFLLCRGESGAVVAFFHPGDGPAYRLDHTLGYDALRPVDYTKMGTCGGGLLPPQQAEIEVEDRRNVAPHEGVRKSHLVADNGTRHDVLIGYTDNAATAMGGESFVLAEIQLSIDVANLAYTNSGIGSALRLVHVMNVDYSENSAFTYGDHLDALWLSNDGKLDAVYAMRETVGADFLSVFIDGRDFLGEVPTCGLGYVMSSTSVNQSFGRNALSIISVSCAAENWSFAHEVGHNRGCGHDRDNASVLGAYSYSYGHRWTGFRSVMAYDNATNDHVRVPQFSNPTILHNGQPTGSNLGNVDEAHNALTHNNTAAVCATFKNERTFVEFGWTESSTGLLVAPFASMAAGLSGSREGGTLVILNSQSSFAGALSNARTYVHVGNGSALLGGN